MLNVMRENLKSLKPLLWIVALSMVGYLGSFFFDYGGGGAGGSWAAKVGDSEIPAQDFLRTAQLIDQQYRQVFGEQYDQMRNQVQLGSQAVNSLIQDELILQDARRMGIRVTPQDLAEAIRSDPALAGPNGDFVGTEEYRLRLSRFPGGVPAYEQVRSNGLLIERWEELVGQAASVSDVEAEEVYRERNERTTLDYVVVPAADREVDETVGDDAIQAWYAAHPDDYQRGERRDIRYVVVQRETEMTGVDVSDAEVRAYYDANLDKYQRREQREARHILLRVEPDATDEAKAAVQAEAEKLLERVRGGEDFAKLAGEHSTDTVSAARGGDLGWFGRGQMVPPFENAVFDTPAGEFAGVVETNFGYHVIQVTGERAAGATPFEEVSTAIRRQLGIERAQAQVDGKAEQLAAAARSGDIAAAAGGREVKQLRVEEGTPPSGLGAAPGFLPAVFSLEAGTVSEPLAVTAGKAVVVVDQVLPAGVAALDEVRDEVRTAILDERRREAAVAAAEVAREGRTELAKIAERLKLEVKDSGELRAGQRNLPDTGGLPAEARDLLFGDAVRVGDIGVMAVPDGALVYEIKSRQAFDPDAFETAKASLKEELLTQRRSELRQAVLERLREQRNIVINNEIVGRFDS